MHHRNSIKSFAKTPISENYFAVVNKHLRDCGSSMRAQTLYLLTRRAEQELEAARIPFEYRDGCTMDFTEACLYPGQVVTRVVLRRMPLNGNHAIWRCMYAGTSTPAHQSEETAIVRLTLSAEEARRSIRKGGGLDKNLYKTSGGIIARTAKHLRLVDAA